VEVKVLNVDIPRSRISLDLLRVLWVPHRRPNTNVFPHFYSLTRTSQSSWNLESGGGGLLGRSVHHTILTPTESNRRPRMVSYSSSFCLCNSLLTTYSRQLHVLPLTSAALDLGGMSCLFEMCSVDWHIKTSSL
jgi:hypothetical protein